ncbi:hypothetical protein [Glaciibacter sp. 2TAF33]|uniref:hypothetical protein n=1 Tax=Glaciibacter sp. 2TAF33 TaxID=3233015 RepID=UPI003F920AFB
MSAGSSRRRISPTIVLSTSLVALLLAVVIISLNIRTDRPTTLDGVTAEVIVDVDSISATLPAGVVTGSVDDSTVSDCPDGGGGQQVAVSRTMNVTADFESAAWIARVTRQYEDKGWDVRLRTLGSRDHVELRLVGQRLLIYRVITTGQEGTRQVIVRSDSRCSEPAPAWAPLPQPRENALVGFMTAS